MKRLLPILLLFAILATSSCQKTDTINCTIYWQLYTQAKYITYDNIQQAFQETFFGYYPRLNDNTVRADNTTRNDVRSLARKLASMADSKLNGTTDPADNNPIEVRLFINYNNSYTEEVWSKTY